MEMLPNKTRVGVGIMKVHCSDAIATDSGISATTPPPVAASDVETIDEVQLQGDDDNNAVNAAGEVELIEKIHSTSPIHQSKLLVSSL